MSSTPERLVWIDCEMTGLNLSVDELVEVAVIVTDFALRPLDVGLTVVIKPSAEALEQMGEFVTEMHTASGLLDELDSGQSLDDAAAAVLDYLRTHVPEPRSAPLAGNSIGTDRAFLAKGMPTVHDYLHYRNLDVSSFKILARQWYPRVYFQAPAKQGGHRARADIIESIRELQYYRQALFVPDPGPTSEEAQQIAARVAEEFATAL